MKNTINFLTALVLVFFTFTSCEEAEDLLNTDFSTTITGSIPVSINQGQDTFNDNIVFSIDNNDTHDYLSNINDVKITKLTYKITNFVGDASGSINGNLLADTIILDTNSFNVKDAFNAVTIFEITDVDTLNSMANLLKNNHEVILRITGESISLNDSMNFKIEITAELDITASAL